MLPNAHPTRFPWLAKFLIFALAVAGWVPAQAGQKAEADYRGRPMIIIYPPYGSATLMDWHGSSALAFSVSIDHFSKATAATLYVTAESVGLEQEAGTVVAARSDIRGIELLKPFPFSNTWRVKVVIRNKKYVLQDSQLWGDTGANQAEPASHEICEWIYDSLTSFPATMQRFDALTQQIPRPLSPQQAAKLDSLENAAAAAVGNGNLGEAIQEYEAALQAVPENAPPDVSQTLQREIMKTKIHYAEQEESAGDAEMMHGKLVQAIGDYQQGLESFPDNGPLDLKEALQDKIANASFQASKGGVALGDAAAKQDKMQEAIRDYEHALRLLPQTVTPSHLTESTLLKNEIQDRIRQIRIRPSIEEENAGAAAARRGEESRSFKDYVSAFESLPEDSPADVTERLRTEMFEAAARVKPPVPIPSEAHQHMVTGAAFLKGAKNSDDFMLAAAEFQKAVQAAPWWGDAYFNLGVAQAAAGKYDEAKKSLQLYLDSNPKPADAQDAKDKIYEIEAREKLTAQQTSSGNASTSQTPTVSEAQIEQKVDEHEQQVARNLSGPWNCQSGCDHAQVSVSGSAFTAKLWAPVAFDGCENDENGQCSRTALVEFAGIIQGLGVNGTATVLGGHINPTNCNFGASSAPFSATISTDGSSIIVNYATHTWETHAHRTIVGIQCYAVDPDGTIAATAILTTNAEPSNPQTEPPPGPPPAAAPPHSVAGIWCENQNGPGTACSSRTTLQFFMGSAGLNMSYTGGPPECQLTQPEQLDARSFQANCNYHAGGRTGIAVYQVSVSSNWTTLTFHVTFSWVGQSPMSDFTRTYTRKEYCQKLVNFSF